MVKMQTWVLPEKIAWVIKRKIGKSTETVCKGGPYKDWYARFATGCRMSDGDYEVICKDSMSGHGFGGGYLTVGSLKICQDYDWEKGAWSKAKLRIGKRYPAKKPEYDYPWLMRLRLKHESERENVNVMVEAAAKVMQSLAQAATPVAKVSSANARVADPLGAKTLMAQAKMALAGAKFQPAAEVKVQHEAEAKVQAAAQVLTALDQAARQLKVNATVAASEDPAVAKTLVNAAVQKMETSLELVIAKLTKAIANHSRSHGGRCPSQLSVLGANTLISDGIGCRLQEEGHPLCRCPYWPFKVCISHQLQARTTAGFIELLGHCRLAIWPLILLLLFVLLISAAWVVWVKR